MLLEELVVITMADLVKHVAVLLLRQSCLSLLLYDLHEDLVHVLVLDEPAVQVTELLHVLHIDEHVHV